MNFIRNTIGSACLALAAAAAGGACADPAFDAFRHLCVDTGDDYAAISAAADKASWKSVQVNVETMEGVTVSGKTTRGGSLGGGDAILSAWTGTKGAIGVSACTVQATAGNYAAALAAAKAWAGFDPQDSTEQKAKFRFTSAGGAPKALTPAEYDGAAAGAGMDIITITGGASGVNLDILKIKK